MDQFIRRRNVERYWRLLDCLSNESDRQTILQLLVEERQKQKMPVMHSSGNRRFIEASAAARL
jgi:hypothetical protein